MFVFNEDEYFYQYQRKHDHCWYDENDISDEEYSEWDEIDMKVDEIILARGAYED